MQQRGQAYFLLMSHPESLTLTAPSDHSWLFQVTRLVPEFAWEIPGFQEPLTSNSYPESPTEVAPPPFPTKHSLCNCCLSHNSGPAPPSPPPFAPPTHTHNPPFCLLYSLTFMALHFSKLPQSQSQSKHRGRNLVSALGMELALPELERWSL